MEIWRQQIGQAAAEGMPPQTAEGGRRAGLRAEPAREADAVRPRREVRQAAGEAPAEVQARPIAAIPVEGESLLRITG